MESDLDRTKALLDALGVAYKVDTDVNTLTFGAANHPKYDSFPPCDKVIGYSGFYTQFNFNPDGRFENVGVYE